MRHDRDEQRYLALGQGYPTAVTVQSADESVGAGGEGTLIASSWVLTAAHVAADLKPDDVAVAGGKTFRIDRIILHPEWHKVADLTRDIALIHLATPLDGIKPAQLYTDTDEQGQMLTLVGHGGQGTGLTGPTGEYDGRVRGATNLVDLADGPYLRFRFDEPKSAGVTDLEGICGPGDSGGPAYIEKRGTLYVAGVGSWQDNKPTQRQKGRYGVFEYYLRVSFFADWIRRTMRTARRTNARSAVH